MNAVELTLDILRHIDSLGDAAKLPIETLRRAGRLPKDQGMIQHFKDMGVEESRLVCVLITALDSGVLSGSYGWEEAGLQVTIYGVTLQGHRFIEESQSIKPPA